jgi:hypothetical protein
MPNWCSNVVEIHHDDKEKIDAIEKEYNRVEKDPKIFNTIRPIPPEHATGEGWYWWCIENWGTKWEPSIYSFERVNDNTLKISMDTAWGPPVALYNYMTEQGYTIDAFYNEEGMAFCGHYSDGSDDYYEYNGLSADEMEHQIPVEIDELFNIIEYQRDREEEEQEEEDDEEYLDLSEGVTDWYPNDIKPVREGLYEITSTAWPFVQRALWNGKTWFTMDVDTFEYTIKAKIEKWRGITEEQHMILQLDLLKSEFEKMDDE